MDRERERERELKGKTYNKKIKRRRESFREANK